MNTIRTPEIVGAIKFEEDEQREKEAGNTKDVGVNQKVPGSWTEGIVEVILIDINTKGDTANNKENVVRNELFGNGKMEGRGAWRSCIEPCKWVCKYLGWGKE